MTRERILRALRSAAVADIPLPSSDGPWTTYRDCVAQFRNALADAGGTCVEVREQSLDEALIEKIASVQAHRIVSLVPSGAKQVSESDARRYEDTELAVCPGTFGVAENGAVWVSGDVVREPALLFLTQHLVLTLDRSEIVHNMHEAYDRLSFGERGYGTFIAGPSKTADIEQALVIGAHGPRSLTVMLSTSQP